VRGTSTYTLEGICVASVLTRPSVGIYKNRPDRKSALSNSRIQINMHAPDVPHDLKVSKRMDGTPKIRYPPDSITLIVANFSVEELTLPTILGVAQKISENFKVSVGDEENADRGTEQTFFLETIKSYQSGLKSM